MKAPRRAVLLLLIVLCPALPLPLLAQITNAPWPAVVMQPTRTPHPTLAPSHSTIQRIRERGNLMIAGVLFDYQPFGYLNEQGEIAGFEVDLIRALAAQWSIDVQFVPVTPSTRIQSLVAGQVDLVAAAMPHNAAAETLLDFSQNYFTDTPALLVRSDAPTIDLTTLAGATIATIQGDSAVGQLQAALAAATVEATIMPFQEYAPALLALKAGQADALLADSVYLTQVANALPVASGLLPLPERQTMAIGIAQGDAYFRNLIDATLTALQQSGAFTALYTQWFPARQAPLLAQLPGQWPYTFANSPSELVLPATSRFVHMQTRGKLLVGVSYDFAPFGFLGDDGQLRGFDIDLCREFARRWLGDADALELVRVTPETAIPLLMAGQVDLIVAALPLTWPNRAAIDFSQSYFLDGQSVLTRVDSTVQDLADLDQKVVAVIGGSGSTADLAMLTAHAASGATIVPTLLPFQELRAAQQALLAGQVDALIGSSVALAQSAQSNPTLKLAVDHFVHQPYAIGIPQFDAQLRDQVNLTLQAMQTEGVYVTIYQHWFATTPTPLELWAPLAIAADQETQAAALLAAVATQLPSLSLSAIATVSTSLMATRPAVMKSTAEPLARPTLVLRPTTTPTAMSAGATPITSPVTATATLPAPLPVLIATSTGRPSAPAVTTTITIRPGINVNARQAPTTTAPILEVLVGGTTWPFLRFSPDGAWVQVQLPGGVQAWVAMPLVLQPDAVVPTPPAQATETPSPSPTPISVLPAVAITATPRLLFTTPATHRVSATDTLASLARQYYGDARLWQLIYAANRTLIGADPNAIPVGVELLIPPPP